MKATIKKVKNIYFAETESEKEKIGGHFTTGLVIELEDGRFLRQQSSDIIMPFEEIKL